MLTALTAGGLSFGSYQQVSLNNIISRAESEIETKKEAINASYEEKNAAITRESNQLIRLSSNVKNAEVAVENGMEGIDTIEGLLNDMRAALGEIERSDSDYYREKFDEYLRELNVTADLYAPNFNPIGSVTDRTTWEPNTISYNPDFTSLEVNLTGVYVGSDFRIEDENGTLWIPDLGSQTLTEYTSYNTEIPEDSDESGRMTSLLTGITNVSDEDVDGNRTFTMIIDGEETTVTGKMVTGGLGVTGTWNYNNFETQDDINAALEDLYNAGITLDGARAQMTANQTIVANDQAQLDKKQDALKEKTRDALYDSLESMTALEQEYNQQIAAMTQNLETMSTQQQTYLSVFASALGGTGNNPLFVDQTV